MITGSYLKSKFAGFVQHYETRVTLFNSDLKLLNNMKKKKDLKTKLERLAF